MSATNETTGKAYTGGNVFRLAAAEAEFGYDEARGWAGFRQWLDQGRVVRKGEHGTPCMTVIETDDGRKPRGFRVFHYDQTTELEGPDAVFQAEAGLADETEPVVSTCANGCCADEKEHREKVRVATQAIEVAAYPIAQRAADADALLARLSTMAVR